MRPEARSVRLDPHGFDLDGEVVPWWSAEVHYWRIERDRWPDVLDAVVDLGFRQVSTYVPWEVHEDGDGFDFTGGRDVAHFLRLAQARGLHAIVRPGPDCGAELPGSGWPRRILDDPACQARRPDGTPYLLLMATAHGSPPSYAAHSFRREVRRWYDAVCAVLAPLQWPAGPILAVQVDNEHGFHFQANAFALDHHPDALARWHRFLAQTFGDVAAMNDAFVESWPSFEVPAPSSADDGSTEPRRLAWVAFRERLRIDVLGELRDDLVERGLDRVVTYHNDYPRTDSPMHLAGLEAAGAVDCSTIDVYLPRQAVSAAADLARRAAGSSRLPVVAETGGGWLALPWLLPAVCEPDDPDGLLAGMLAGGVRGFNIYMAVERDRWYAAPVDRHGRVRDAYAAPYRRISRLLGDTLRARTRRPPVLLVENRAQQRRHQAADLCGDGVACFAQVLPMDIRLTTGRDDGAARADRWLDEVAAGLRASGVDHDRCTDTSPALGRYDLVVFASDGVADPQVLDELRRTASDLVVGPTAPVRDGWLRPHDHGPMTVVADTAEVVAHARAIRNQPGLAGSEVRAATFSGDDDTTSTVVALANDGGEPVTVDVPAGSADAETAADLGGRCTVDPYATRFVTLGAAR